MAKSIYITISPILILLSFSCVSSEKNMKELSLKVLKSEVNAWLNLMPGISPGKFHLTGKITFQNLSDNEIKNISLDNLKVYSSEEVIYSFKPFFANKIKEENFNLKKGVVKEFTFGIEKGLKIDERLNDNEFINTTFNFISDEGAYYYSVDSIKVVKAY